MIVLDNFHGLVGNSDPLFRCQQESHLVRLIRKEQMGRGTCSEAILGPPVSPDVRPACAISPDTRPTGLTLQGGAGQQALVTALISGFGTFLPQPRSKARQAVSFSPTWDRR